MAFKDTGPDQLAKKAGIWSNPEENSLAVPQKIKRRVAIGSRNSTLLCIDPKELKTGVQTKTYTRVFSAALFTIAKRSKQSKCPLTDEWMKKIGSNHTMKYYSAMKRNEALTHATIWMNPENIMLSERNQTQKST